MIPRRARWNGEWLPIPEKPRRRPRVDEDDEAGQQALVDRAFEGNGLRSWGSALSSPQERLVGLVRSQLRQAAAIRIVGEALAIAAPRDEEGKPAWGDGAHLAHGSSPHEAGFARVHLQMSPAESAAARRAAAAEKKFPRIGEYERMGYIRRADGRRLREIASSEEQVSAWLSLAETGDPGALRRRLRRARKGETPNEVQDPGLGPKDEAAGPETDADHVMDLSLRLTHRDGETWDRAVRVAGGRLRAVLSVPDALREFLSVTSAELVAGRAPATLDETVPFRDWHVDPISQTAWLETGKGPWAVSAKGVPSGPDVRVRVLGPDRRRVEPSVRTLLEAYPELEDDAPGEEPWSEPWRSRGLVTWGIRPPIGEELAPAPYPLAASPRCPEPVEGCPRLALSLPKGVAASSLPDLPSLSPADAAGIAAAAARAYHSFFSDEVEALATWETLARHREGSEDQDILLDCQALLGLSTRCWL
ncbi:MAG: hypothetical protein L0216_03790, partial [Planctomycetales bacterium]|nr:hypothetical protein [Planctomycetales bacterium]